jgi:arginine/serine-rich splicing factor 4/5/6
MSSHGSFSDNDSEKSVFVGGLPYSINERDLFDLFEKHGKINKINKKKGYCFIQYFDKNGASEAIKNLHGKNLDGSRITVDLVKGNKKR